ncbi:hypothetical protein TWF506_000056 [Arthrobotrys conoides]|uniref:BTB domain-containing protein n=1 Tax=Arthrobotrys conoides TaxID=74498 RepID=A0AAN8NUQ1_9PEZI
MESESNRELEISNLVAMSTLDDLPPSLLGPKSTSEDLAPALKPESSREFFPPMISSQSEADTESTVDQPLDTPSETSTSSSCEPDPTNSNKSNNNKTPVKNIRITEEFNFVITTEKQSTGMRYNYYVSKQVLSISSPYFKSLFQQHSEKQRLQSGKLGTVEEMSTQFGQLSSTGNKIKLQGCPDAFLSILSIIHFRQSLERNLRDLDFKSLTNIAFVAEKYRWVGALLPWVTLWAWRYAEAALDPGFENWLFISHVFNFKDRVDELVLLLSRQCSVDGAVISRSVLGAPQALNTTLWPSHLKDRILTRRQQRIDQLYSYIRILLCALRSTQSTQANLEVCAGPEESARLGSRLCSSDLCHALAFGSLVQSLDAIDPRIAMGDKDLNWTGPAEELEQELLKKVGFSTLGSIEPEHVCNMQNLQASLTKCLKGETVSSLIYRVNSLLDVETPGWLKII